MIHIADLTSVTSIGDDLEVNPADLLVVVGALIVSLSLAFGGVQTADLPLFAIGVLFAVLVGAALSFDVPLLASPASFGAVAAAYWAGRSVFIVLGTIGLSFSFFSTATNSYLSLLGQTPTTVQVIVNQFLAAVQENLFIITLAVLAYTQLRRLGFQPTTALVTSASVFGTVFALLHGATSIGFIILAGSIMAFWIGSLIGEDVGLFELSIVPATFLFTVGLHQANNIAAFGGNIRYYNVLFQAASGGQFQLAAATILIVEGLLLLGALAWSVQNADRLANV